MKEDPEMMAQFYLKLLYVNYMCMTLPVNVQEVFNE